jgi:hypothetical protein
LEPAQLAAPGRDREPERGVAGVLAVKDCKHSWEECPNGDDECSACGLRRRWGVIIEPSADALVSKLMHIAVTLNGNPERAHVAADEALLEHINNDRVRDAYEQVTRWYS